MRARRNGWRLCQRGEGGQGACLLAIEIIRKFLADLNHFLALVRNFSIAQRAINSVIRTVNAIGDMSPVAAMAACIESFIITCRNG